MKTHLTLKSFSNLSIEEVAGGISKPATTELPGQLLPGRGAGTD